MTKASILGILTFALGVPAAFLALYTNPGLKRPLLTLMALFTCYIKKPLYMEVFFVPYRGVDRGFGVTVPDLLFFGFFFWILVGGSRRKIVWWPCNTTFWQLLFAFSALSLMHSQTPYYGLFTLHKFFRGYLLYWVTVNLVHDKDDVRAVVDGVMAAVILQTGIVIWAKYVTHTVVNRSVGSFPHPNSLAMYVDLIIPMILALLLADGFPPDRRKWAALAVLGGLVCVVFSKSRASLLIVGAALAGVTGLSIMLRPTSRKFMVALAGLAMICVMGAIAAPKIIQRFEKAPEASEATRVYFNAAARAMANDHFWGTGLNSFSWMLAHTDYYWFMYRDAEETVRDQEEFRESKMGQSRLGTAHHIYYLFAAEIGWLGMTVFVLFLARYYLQNLYLLFRSRDEYCQAILLGLLVGFSTLHLQGFLEWIFRQTQVFYLFCLLSGLMVAIGANVEGAGRRS